MKNKFLLLATTALLSMGAIAANSANTNISGTPAKLDASVKFMEPVSITQTQALHFGTLLRPQAGQTVVWGPSDLTAVSSGSTAQQVFTSGAQAPKIGIMKYTGPNLTKEQSGIRLLFSSTQNGTQGENATVPLTSGSGQNAKTCGSVLFTPNLAKSGSSSYGDTSALNNNDEIYIGGAFTVDENYDNSISYGECTGSVYVTLVIQND